MQQLNGCRGAGRRKARSVRIGFRIWLAKSSAWTATVDRYLRWMETLTAPPDSFLDSLRHGCVAIARPRAAQRSVAARRWPKGIRSRGSDSGVARHAGDPRPTSPRGSISSPRNIARRKANAVETVQQHARACGRTRAGSPTRSTCAFSTTPSRRLFGVGYAVGGPLEFTSHYDLLASECRLASLVAIAKGDVPVEHWFALARPLASIARRPDAALLERHHVRVPDAAAVHAQLSRTRCSITPAATRSRSRSPTAHEKNVPWGVSESAYSALDANQIYQYRAFGVPALALKPGLEDDLVVSPYSTMLALLVDPGSGHRESAASEALRSRRSDGFYESIDFSRENSATASAAWSFTPIWRTTRA